jgi:hypothetical protein
MDMLDLNPGVGQYTLDYGVPRIYHVCSSDFKIVTQFDRNHLASSYEYGLLDVSILLSFFYRVLVYLICYVFYKFYMQAFFVYDVC